jgi:hypothetical protein
VAAESAEFVNSILLQSIPLLGLSIPPTFSDFAKPSPMPEAAARITEHPRAVCHNVWLRRAASRYSERAEGRREIEATNGGWNQFNINRR